jgi:hypothetical protein
VEAVAGEEVAPDAAAVVDPAGWVGQRLPGRAATACVPTAGTGCRTC